MDPNAARIMADSYREGSGHSRTAYRVRLLLGLDTTGCTKQWAAAVSMAWAYQAAHSAAAGDVSRSMRSLRKPFEEALQAAIRRDGVNIVKRKRRSEAPDGSMPAALRKLSSDWKKSSVGYRDRESLHKSRVRYTHLLSSSREEDIQLVKKQSVAHLVRSKGGPSTILEGLSDDFKARNPGWEAREALYAKRVKDPKCLRIKLKRKKSKKKAP